MYTECSRAFFISGEHCALPGMESASAYLGGAVLFDRRSSSNLPENFVEALSLRIKWLRLKLSEGCGSVDLAEKACL